MATGQEITVTYGYMDSDGGYNMEKAECRNMTEAAELVRLVNPELWDTKDLHGKPRDVEVQILVDSIKKGYREIEKRTRERLLKRDTARVTKWIKEAEDHHIDKLVKIANPAYEFIWHPRFVYEQEIIDSMSNPVCRSEIIAYIAKQ